MSMEMKQEESRQQQYTENYQYEDDHINLLDYAIVLLKHKWMIFFFVLIAGVIAVIYSLSLTNIYRSECTIAPVQPEKASLSSRLSALGGLGNFVASQVNIGGSGSLRQFVIVLKSRKLTNYLVEKYNLMPLLFKDAWDEEKKKWKVEDQPSLLDAHGAIQGMMEIIPDTGNNVLRLGLLHKDPEMANRILTYYVVGLSEFLRQQAIENVAVQRKALQEQLVNMTDPLFRTKLAEIIAQYVEKETLVKVQKYYGFNILDYPFVPQNRIKPNRRRICKMSVIIGFFIAVALAFFMEYLNNIKKNRDPAKLGELKKYMKLRNREKDII